MDDDIVWLEYGPEFEQELSDWLVSVGYGVASGSTDHSDRLGGEDASDEEFDDDDFEADLSTHHFEGDDEPSSQSDNSLSERVARVEFISRFECVVDDELELLDPKPDFMRLFDIFDERFFSNQFLASGVKVHVGWGKGMTKRTGKCVWNQTILCIRLSDLLKRRGATGYTRRVVIEAMLHQMIHAYLGLTNVSGDYEHHGSDFVRHVARIDQDGGCTIPALTHSLEELHQSIEMEVSMQGSITDFFSVTKRQDSRAGPSCSTQTGPKTAASTQTAAADLTEGEETEVWVMD